MKLTKTVLREIIKEELTLLKESKEFFNSFKKDFDNVVRYADAYLKGNVITVYLDTDPQNEVRKINKLVQTKYKNNLRKMNSEADVMLFKIISDVVEVKQITEKSKEASMVLQLMDKDYTYGDALKKVLSKYNTVNKNKLEKELNKYI
jgi:hypothetical protein